MQYIRVNKKKLLEERKKKKRYIILISTVFILALIFITCILINNNKDSDKIHFTDDKCTEEISKAIEQYKNDKVKNHFFYQRLSDEAVVEKTEKGEIITSDSEFTQFSKLAGKGNFPGCGLYGENIELEIRKQLALAIKAYTTIEILQDTNTLKDITDTPTHSYVYFYITGEVKLVENTYLDKYKSTNEQINVYDCWIYLTREGCSKKTEELKTTNEKNLYLLINNNNKDILSNATIKLSSIGGYAKQKKTNLNNIICFTEIPNGVATLTVTHKGYADFPNKDVYHITDSYEIFVNDKEYKGQRLTDPLTITLKKTAYGTLTFGAGYYKYDNESDKTEFVSDNGKANYTINLTNKETNKKTSTIIQYNGEAVNIADYYDDLAYGEYKVEVLPSDKTLGTLNIETLYFNQYGFSESSNQTEASQYNFTFQSKATSVISQVKLNDKTTSGLIKINPKLNLYSKISTEAMNIKPVIVYENKEETIETELGDNNTFISSLIPNHSYKVYLKTQYGRILIKNDFTINYIEYKMNINVTDEMLPECGLKLEIIPFYKSEKYSPKKVYLKNCQTDKVIDLEKEDGKYVYDSDTNLIQSGYYLVCFEDDGLKSPYQASLILLSEYSNNISADVSVLK